MRATLLAGFGLVSLFVSGCKEKAPEPQPLGDTAPAYANNLAQFVVGRWAIVDSGMGGSGKANPNHYYEFKADGTFECGQLKQGWTSTGRYTAADPQVNLTYETMNGKPIQQFEAEYKKDEEGGGQASVAKALMYDDIYAQLGRMTIVSVGDDSKRLQFGAPSSQPPVQEGEMSLDLSKFGVVELERMGIPAK